MNRRNFSKNALGSLAALSFNYSIFAHNLQKQPLVFKQNYAPHFGMFKNYAGNDLVKQLEFMASRGFGSLEDNGMLERTKDTQILIGKTLERLNMKMGVFVIDGGENWTTSLATGQKEYLDNFIEACKKSVETAKLVNAKYMTVVPGYFDRTKSMGLQTANVIEAMRRGAEIFEKHNLIMVMEPLSDNADLFLRHTDQAFEICKAVNSPSCKILYDIYHMQRNEGNLIKTIDDCYSEIAYFQIGDNPGRNEPTSGEINYKNIFKHVYNKGYRGIWGMEHGNAAPGKEGEEKLIQAYIESDKF